MLTGRVSLEIALVTSKLDLTHLWQIFPFHTPFRGYANGNISQNPAKIYLFKVSNRNTRKRWEICSNLTIKTPERRPLYPMKTPENHWFSGVFRGYKRLCSGVFIVILLLSGCKLKFIPKSR